VNRGHTKNKEKWKTVSIKLIQEHNIMYHFFSFEAKSGWLLNN